MNLQYGVTFGYEEILWRSVGDEPSREFLPYSAVQEDEIRWVFIPHWHNLSVGDLCWLLYQPALSYFNGWPEHPEELELSSIVNCEIIEFHEPISRLQKARETEAEERAFYGKFQLELEKQNLNVNAQFSLPPASEIAGWALVRCQRVVPLTLIPNVFLNRPIDVIFAKTPGDSTLRFESKNLLGESSVIAQECAEEWIIVKSHPPRVVYHSLSIDNGIFEICNAPLAEMF